MACFKQSASVSSAVRCRRTLSLKAARVAGSLFPMELAQGFTVDMAPGGGAAFPDGAPSLLGPTYVATQGRQQLVVGATKRTGLSAEDALRVGLQGHRLSGFRPKRPTAAGQLQELMLGLWQ